MRGHESGVRHQRLPSAADINKIVAVSPIAMQEDDKLARRRAGAGLKPRTVDFSGHWISDQTRRLGRVHLRVV